MKILVVDDEGTTKVFLEKPSLDYAECAKLARQCLIAKQLSEAEYYIKEAQKLAVDSPEPQNLLGVLYELTDNLIEAQAHYRAALALDPTYRPADNNLARTTLTARYRKDMDLGGNHHEA
ncbi:tetratricopeptide repeat protein [Fusibacter sp. JL298sf-3]